MTSPRPGWPVSLRAQQRIVQFVEWAARMMRTAASPATVRAFGQMQSLMDAREVLPLIRVPTLVLDRADARLPKGPVDMPPLEEARYVGGPDSRARSSGSLPGRDYLPWVGDQDSIVAEVGKFVTGAAPVRRAGPCPAHRSLHRHGRLDKASRRARRQALARATRATQRPRASIHRRVPRARDRSRR